MTGDIDDLDIDLTAEIVEGTGTAQQHRKWRKNCLNLLDRNKKRPLWRRQIYPSRKKVTLPSIPQKDHQS